MSDDYLVFIEEDDDGAPDDRLVLKVGGRQRHLSDLEIQPEIDVELVNRGSGLSVAGLLLSLAGMVAAIGALVMFFLYYPDNWTRGEEAAQLTAIMAAAGIVLLALGTVLAPIGRRMQARGVLRSVRVVEKPE